jgi:hypothetical protein
VDDSASGLSPVGGRGADVVDRVDRGPERVYGGVHDFQGPRPALERLLRRADADRGGGHGAQGDAHVPPRVGATPGGRRDHLRDRLRAPRPDLPEPLLAIGPERDPDADQELVRPGRRLAIRRPEVGRGDLALPGRAAHDEHGVQRQQDRERVAGR